MFCVLGPFAFGWMYMSEVSFKKPHPCFGGCFSVIEAENCSGTLSSVFVCALGGIFVR